MKINELVGRSVNRAEILKILQIFKKYKVNFTVIGSAALALQINDSAPDIDILIGNKGNLDKIPGKFYSYRLNPESSGDPRKVEINGVKIDLTYPDDFEPSISKKLLNANIDLIEGFDVLSLKSIVETSTREKRHEKLEKIIRKLNLPEHWFKNLDPKYWNEYAVAYDTVHDIDTDMITRWRHQFSKLNEIWISKGSTIRDLNGLNFNDFNKLNTIYKFKNLELKKVENGATISYALMSPEERKVVGIVRLKLPDKILRKFPEHVNPGWRQIHNLFVDPEFRREGLATFFYEYIILKEGITIISDDSQTSETIELWRNKLAGNPKFKLWAEDLLNGQQIAINSSNEFDKIKTWVYENYKVYFVVQRR